MMMRGENEDHEELTVKQEYDDTSWTEPILKSGINERTTFDNVNFWKYGTILQYLEL